MQKHGYWKYIQYGSPEIGNWHCSVCSSITLGYNVGDYKFCPNCGAKMIGKSDKDNPEKYCITFYEYQEMAKRTMLDKCKSLANVGLGLTGESGKAVNLIKKHLFQGQKLNKDKLIEKLGDTLWYIVLAAETLGIELGEIASKNIEKLQQRYPNGYFDKSGEN